MSRLRFAALTAVMGLMSMVGAFAAVAVFTGGQPVSADGESKVVQATEFQLLDGNGTARGVWGVTDEGMSLFSLLDPKGKPRLTLATDKKNGTVITLTDHDGKQRMTQAVKADGMAVITYYHPDGETQAFQVSTTGEGESSLILYDKTKTNSILASVMSDGRSVLALERNNDVRFRAMLGTDGTPEMGFITKNEKGKMQYTWQAGK
jgi:hypothetical protein